MCRLPRGFEPPLHRPCTHIVPYRALRPPVHPSAPIHSPTQVFEGIPAPYDKMKRMVVPLALRVTRLKPGRPFAVLGRLCHEVGWKHLGLIKRLEDARKTASLAAYKKKSEAVKRLSAARKALSA